MSPQHFVGAFRSPVGTVGGRDRTHPAFRFRGGDDRARRYLYRQKLWRLVAGEFGNSFTGIVASQGTVAIPPSINQLPAPPAGTAPSALPIGTVGAAAGSSAGFEPGVAGVASAPAMSAMPPNTVIVVGPGTGTSDAPASPGPTGFDTVSSSGASELLVGPSPFMLQVNRLSLTRSSTESVASASGTIMTAEPASGFTLPSDLSGVSIAVSSSANQTTPIELRSAPRAAAVAARS